MTKCRWYGPISWSLVAIPAREIPYDIWNRCMALDLGNHGCKNQYKLNLAFSRHKKWAFFSWLLLPIRHYCSISWNLVAIPARDLPINVNNKPIFLVLSKVTCGKRYRIRFAMVCFLLDIDNKTLFHTYIL